MSLRIVHPICCGIDVHKSFVVACIASTDDKGITSYKSRRFSTFSKDLRLLSDWLSLHHCHDVCMESTGKYWIPVYNILEPSCRVLLAHPKYVKAIPGKKTDPRDAKWIADLFKHNLVAAICRMLLSAIYSILKKSEAYNPTLYKTVELTPSRRSFTVEQAVAFVKRHGYRVVDSGGGFVS